MSEKQENISITDGLKAIVDKATNPVILTFFIAWCISNWKIILFLFLKNNSVTFDVAVKYIEVNLNFCNSLLYPVLAVLFYTILLPNISRFLVLSREWISGILHRFEKHIVVTKTRKKSDAEAVERETKFELTPLDMLESQLLEKISHHNGQILINAKCSNFYQHNKEAIHSLIRRGLLWISVPEQYFDGNNPVVYDPDTKEIVRVYLKSTVLNQARQAYIS